MTENSSIVIKKYANRRLYNTKSSTYVTLEDLAVMIRDGDLIQVFDAKTNEDITRQVMTQIIFEQEAKVGTQGLLPLAFLQQLIRFYGDGMQSVVPRYLEMSLDRLVDEQQKLRSYITDTFGAKNIATNLANQTLEQLEEATKQNMVLFNQALSLFSPFKAPEAGGGLGESKSTPQPTPAQPTPAQPSIPAPIKQNTPDDLASLRAEMAEMQAKLEAMSRMMGEAAQSKTKTN